MYTPTPTARVRTSPSPAHARRARGSARWILTSGTIEARDEGLFLQPDEVWSRVFTPADGWFVAQWYDVASVELARGGRYSLWRGRLTVRDRAGARVFRGEVDLRDAYRVLEGARPNGVAFRIEPETTYFGARRYVVDSVGVLAVGGVRG